jgi:hypothetical protein
MFFLLQDQQTLYLETLHYILADLLPWIIRDSASTVLSIAFLIWIGSCNDQRICFASTRCRQDHQAGGVELNILKQVQVSVVPCFH